MIDSEPIRVGIVGTGAVAKTHVYCVNEHPESTLISMASSKPESAKKAENAFGVKVYAGYEAMLENEELDVVVITTPSGLHLEPTVAAAERGCHVLVEKPLEVTVDRALQMQRACIKQQVKLACVFQNRWNPSYKQLKHLIDDDGLGNIYYGKAFIPWWRDQQYYQNSQWKGTQEMDGGGALINQGIHTIDLLLDCLGTVDEVFGDVSTLRHAIEGEDFGQALLSFRSGAKGYIMSSTALLPGSAERLEIYGEKGFVVLEGGNMKTWQVEGHPTVEIQSATGTGASDPMAIGNMLHYEQWNAFLSAIRNYGKPPVDFDEALKPLALIEAIYKSSKRGAKVRLD